MRQTWKVTYLARSGNEDDCEVEVRPTINEDNEAGFYAVNLRLWGCGKTRMSPELAIRSLIQDMATILNMERVG